MKKIFNWITGSFFRTLGRIICYLSIGFIIALIVSKMDLNLFIMPVNASTIDVTDAKFNLYTAITRDNCNLATSYGYKKFNSSTDITDKPYINKVHYLISANLQANQSYTLTLIQSYNPKSSVLQTINTLIYRMEAGTTDSNLSANNISSFKCFATNDKTNNFRINLTCNFVPLSDIKKIWLEQLHPNCGTSANYFNTYTLKINSNSSTEESINNQTEVIIDKSDKIIEGQDKINDTINNTDTSGATDNANGFFNDFSDTDFGLSSIVTAPLRAINAMLNNTCVAPSATYKGQTFSLPCGNILWDRPGGDTFKTFLNVMYGGFLAYFVIRKFFLDVENLKNPNNDKVEVDKL